MIKEPVPGWVASRWPQSPHTLSEVGPQVWQTLGSDGVNRLAKTVLAIATRDARAWYDLPIPEVTLGYLELLDGSVEHRTKHALTISLSQGQTVRSVGDLLKVRNLGVRSLLDYLSALDAVTNGTVVLTPGRPVAASLVPVSYLGHSPSTALLFMLASISDRDRLILSERTLNQRPKRLRELAETLGLTRERVRQLESKAVRALGATLNRPDNHQVERALDSLRAQFPHNACLRTALTAAIKNTFPVPIDASLPDFCVEVVRFLLGFPVVDECFAYRNERAPIWQAIWQALSAGYAQNEEPRFLQLTAVALDVPYELVEAVRDTLDLRPVKGILLPWTGSMADKAERVLLDAGEPLDFEPLCSALELTGSSRDTLRNYIISDPRFQRVTRTRIALTAWGLEGYSSIRDAIQRRVRDAGGKVLLTTLLEELPHQFDVAESSVRAYAAGPGFRVDDLGFVSESQIAREAGAAQSDPARNRLLFRHGGTWYLRLTINPDYVRGSGHIIPVAAAVQLGLAPGNSTERWIDGQLVRFSWSTAQPNIGSVRSLIEHHGADLDDLLFIGLTAFGEPANSFVIPPPSETMNGLQRLCALAGIMPAPLDSAKAIHQLAMAIGIPSRAVSVDVLRLFYSERRDTEALQLLPSDPVAPARSSPMRQLATLLDR